MTSRHIPSLPATRPECCGLLPLNPGELMSGHRSPLLDRPEATVKFQDQRADLRFSDWQRPANVVRVGVIGYGYWGPNIVRNFHGLENCELVALCDTKPDALRRAHRAYPGVHLTTDFNEILTDRK